MGGLHHGRRGREGDRGQGVPGELRILTWRTWIAIALVARCGGVALAQPPRFEDARRIARVWFAAARGGRTPRSSGPDLVVELNTGAECDREYAATELLAAVQCIHQAFAHLPRPHDWRTESTDRDTLWLIADIDARGCTWLVSVYVDGGGTVTRVGIELARCS